jgi:hypothetical protein
MAGLLVACASTPVHREVAGSPVPGLWTAIGGDVALGAPHTFIVTSGALRDDVVKLTEPTMRTAQNAFGRDSDAETLWADPSLADPTAGREVLVGRTYANDDDLNVSYSGTTVRVGGHAATLTHVGPLWVVSWDVATGDCPCHQTAVVVGRNMTRASVVALAAVARPTASRPALPAASLPKGLRSLGSVPQLAPIDGSPVGERIEIGLGADTVDYSVVGTDPRLAAHAAFWVGRARPLTFQHARTFAGVTIVDGLVVTESQVSSSDAQIVSAAQARRGAAALVRASRAQADAAVASSLTRPAGPEDQCDTSPSGAVIVLHPTGGRMVLGLSAKGSLVQVCDDIETSDEHLGGGESGGPIGPQTAIRIDSVVHEGLADGKAFSIFAGDIDASVTRLTVSQTGVEPFDIVVSRAGPSNGRRWFAAAARVLTVARTAPVVTGYDGEGRVVETTANG